MTVKKLEKLRRAYMRESEKSRGLGVYTPAAVKAAAAYSRALVGIEKAAVRRGKRRAAIAKAKGE